MTNIFNIAPSEVSFPPSDRHLDTILYSNLDIIPDTIREKLDEAVRLLQQDKPVAIPTETVYGLAANALSDSAVKEIFRVKGRPSDNPLIVHVSSLEMLARYLDTSPDSTHKKYTREEILGYIPEKYHVAISRFWPGPLTILVPTTSKVIILIFQNIFIF